MECWFWIVSNYHFTLPLLVLLPHFYCYTARFALIVDASNRINSENNPHLYITFKRALHAWFQVAPLATSWALHDNC